MALLGYGYDTLGQVTTGAKKWPDGSLIVGQQYAYAFDDIGNRRTSTLNSRLSTYSANSLNQYTQRTVPVLPGKPAAPPAMPP